MINETTIADEALLSAWVIHFSLAGCTRSVLREKLKNHSNIHFWESVTLDESMQFDFIYFLTQMFLSEDIEPLERIILKPEEIHELVQQMASVRKSLNEAGELNEANYRTEINRHPYIRCNFNDQKCVSFELLVTDLFDPDHNLRGLLRDLKTSFKTRNVTRGIEVRDNSCVMSQNATKCTRDKGDTEVHVPSSQGSKQTWRKGSRNLGPTLAEKNAPTTLTSSKSQSKSTEKNPLQLTQKKSRKRRISSNRKILKMRRIDTYFKPIPKGEALDTDICVTKENLPDCHTTQVTHLSALKAPSVTMDLTLGTKDDCIEIYDIETAANMDISDSENNTNLHHQDKNVFQLDAKTRQMIRDWCGGDTFLTQESSGSFGEVLEQDKTTENDNDKNERMTINEHHNWNNNDKFDDDNDDDDNNNDYDNGVMNGHLYRNGHNGNNDKSDSSNESNDDDGDNDDDDDDDNGVMIGDLNHDGPNENNDKSDSSNESDDNDDDDDNNDNDDNCVMTGDLYHNGHNGNNDKSDSSNESDDDSDDDDDDIDDDDDHNGVMNRDLYHNGPNGNNDKSDSSNESDDDSDDDDDDIDDDDDHNGVMTGDLYHNGPNGNNDKSDSSNESDDDSDDDDDDDDIESDDVNDEDYVYDSEDESDSESDEDYNNQSIKFKHTLSPGHVQRFQRKKRR